MQKLTLYVSRHAKQKVISAAVNVYTAHNKKDENIKIKYANDEIYGGSKINPGYSEHWISESQFVNFLYKYVIVIKSCSGKSFYLKK